MNVKSYRNNIPHTLELFDIKGMKLIVLILLVFVSFCSSENKPDIEINLNVNIESQKPLASDNPTSEKELALFEGIR